MISLCHFINIVIYIFIQQSTQVPILRNNVKSLPPFVLRHHRRVDIETDRQKQLQNVTLNRQKLQQATEDKKELADVTATVNGIPFQKNIKKKKSPTRYDLSRDINKQENINMLKYEDDMKYDDKDRKPEYDAYGKRYYPIAVEDDSIRVRYDIYEDDAGMPYYKVYVIDDRAVRYYPETRRSNKQSQKAKVPLNQQIYDNIIQNFDQNNVFNHPTPCPENQLADGIPSEKNIKKKKRPTRYDISIEIGYDENLNMLKYEVDMKPHNKDRKPEYDAHGKRYYPIAVENDGNGVRYDIYEDDAGTRYYKVYVIDDRAGYVVINGVRYYPKTRPSIKQSQKPKVPLNQQNYGKIIQNFDRSGMFSTIPLADKIKKFLNKKLGNIKSPNPNKLFSKSSYFASNAAQKTHDFNLKSMK
ncbi:uncharacterized protein LOC124541250 [Vanessa cardui]|uniref:uncharacterized protein LOC124541250 n=1 Tax=Vanessa cardui TaxID=171605 RepID=UPI001F13D953|nr:uncharacterized protein LOC124541250 [Vanessa cardui]